jgi:hypothetical protein
VRSKDNHYRKSRLLGAIYDTLFHKVLSGELRVKRYGKFFGTIIMSLPPSVLKKYLDRFDELIQEGEKIYQIIKYITDGYFRDSVQGTRPLNQQEIEEQQKLEGWNLNYLSLLDQIIPPTSVHRNLLNERGIVPIPPHKSLNTHIVRLKGLKDDLEKGFLGDLGLEIEAAIVADYMGQAEQLLAEGQSGKYDHVPAAVLAGAVLEKSLRTLFDKQSPPILTVNSSQPLTLNPLINALKKNNLFNELTAKQLRAWADIRNSAAHGNFDEFDRNQVALMIHGINHFLETHMI